MKIFRNHNKCRFFNCPVSVITLAVALIYIGITVWWHVYTPDYSFDIQAPGADNRPEGMIRKTDEVLIGEFFMRYNDESPSLTGKWTCFRGSDFSNTVNTVHKISVAEGDYKEEWEITAGEGHAASVIFNGRVYVLDYDESLRSDALRCISLESGRELWRRWYRVPMKRNHGFSRTAPAVGDSYVITLGPMGHVMCCNPVTGAMKWSLDLQKHFDTEIPFWYAGQCPRVDGNTLVLAPAGKKILLTGIDCDSGEIIWQTPNEPNCKMSHSSVTPMTLNGKKTYVYAGIGGVCGVSAETDDRGTLLWHTGQWKPSVIAPSPLQLSANNIFTVAGYGAGGALLQVNNVGRKRWNVTVKEQYKPGAGMSSEQQTPILYNGMLISIMPKDGGTLRGRLVLHSPLDLHRPVWASAERFGLGPYMVINNKLFVLNDDGELYVYEIQPTGMNLLKKQRVMDGADAWGPMAYADGRLIIRDAHKVKCLKII